MKTVFAVTPSMVKFFAMGGSAPARVITQGLPQLKLMTSPGALARSAARNDPAGGGPTLSALVVTSTIAEWAEGIAIAQRTATNTELIDLIRSPSESLRSFRHPTLKICGRLRARL
jgi:hypothetical protein